MWPDLVKSHTEPKALPPAKRGAFLNLAERGGEMSTGMPRRNDLLLNVSAELRIRDAIGAIERMEADQYLSLAQSKLEEALNLVADFVDDKAKFKG